MGVLVVLTTFPDRSSAESVLKTLVEERLVACAQVVGEIKSFYRWKGELEAGKEILCFLKTSDRVYPELEKRLAELHPYELPQIVAVPASFVFAPYLKWVSEEVK